MASPLDEITVTYDAKDTPLNGRPKVDAVVYNYINYRWVAADLKMSGANNHFEGKYKIPANTGIIAFKFTSDTLVDNADNQGYFVFLFDKEKGINAPGAYAGWGLARSPSYNQMIEGYINFKGITDSATYHWLNQEISFHQSAKSKLAYLYTYALNKVYKDNYLPKTNRVLGYLERKDATESDLLTARKIYQRILNDNPKADSLSKILELRFPKGTLDRLAAYKRMNALKDMDERLTAFERFLIDYPRKKENEEFDAENFINYDSIYQTIILINVAKTKNYAILDQYINELSFESLSALYYRLVDISFMKKDTPNDKLLALSEKLFRQFEKIRDLRPENYEYLSPKEWNGYYQELQSTRNFGIHASLLNSAKRYKEAAAYIKQAIAVKGYKTTFLNDIYATTLSKLGDNKTLKVVLEKSYHENQVSINMIDLMKKLYVKAKGTNKNYLDYLASLQNKEAQASELTALKSKMINKPLPDFAMKDLNGKMVKLSDLKGKTVVLDFWATWCVPCKASFPGMKLAVEKYKNDPNVVFYFVDTQERGNTYKADVAKYIKENNYPFQVLFDNPVASDQSTGEVFGRIAKAFTISGIPQKLFVDGNGNVRFISIGFEGSTTGLADEISALIEFTKTAK